jgi:hypothetical protein
MKRWRMMKKLSQLMVSGSKHIILTNVYTYNIYVYECIFIYMYINRWSPRWCWKNYYNWYQVGKSIYILINVYIYIIYMYINVYLYICIHLDEALGGAEKAIKIDNKWVKAHYRETTVYLLTYIYAYVYTVYIYIYMHIIIFRWSPRGCWEGSHCWYLSYIYI